MLSGLMLLRELRGRGRWRSTFVWRTVNVLLLGGVVAFLAFQAKKFTGYGLFLQNLAAVGELIFGPFGVLQASFVFLYALFSAAGSMAGEKGGRTLGLLLISGARPRAIVQAKCLAALAPALLLLAAGLPFLFTLVGLGGVEPGQAASLAALAASLAALGAGMGVFAGAAARREREAHVLGVALILWWFVLLPFLAVFLGGWLEGYSPAHYYRRGAAPSLSQVLLGVLHPLPAMANVLDPGNFFYSTPGWAANALLNLALGLVFLALARWVLSRHLLAPEAPERSRPAAGRRRGAWPLPGEDPVAWREAWLCRGGSYYRWGRNLALAGVFLAPLVYLLFSSEMRYRRWSWTLALDLAGTTADCGLLLGGAVALLLLLFTASRAFAVEKESQVGELLLATRLEPAQILRGKLKGALAGARFFLFLTAASGGLFLAVDLLGGSLYGSFRPHYFGGYGSAGDWLDPALMFGCCAWLLLAVLLARLGLARARSNHLFLDLALLSLPVLFLTFFGQWLTQDLQLRPEADGLSLLGQGLVQDSLLFPAAALLLSLLAILLGRKTRPRFALHLVLSSSLLAGAIFLVGLTIYFYEPSRGMGFYDSLLPNWFRYSPAYLLLSQALWLGLLLLRLALGEGRLARELGLKALSCNAALGLAGLGFLALLWFWPWSAGAHAFFLGQVLLWTCTSLGAAGLLICLALFFSLHLRHSGVAFAGAIAAAGAWNLAVLAFLALMHAWGGRELREEAVYALFTLANLAAAMVIYHLAAWRLPARLAGGR